FLFVRLVPGSYAVKVEKEGFKAADVKGVEVSIGRTASLNLRLEPGAVSEVVEVTARAVAIDTTSTTTGSNLSDTFYQSVPVPRNVSGLFYVAPGVADSGGAGRANPSVSGGSGLENLYVADGVNITDAAFGGLGIFSRPYGSVGSGINLSFIKEVQVKTGGFEPQYGQSTGGVVQIVTKSGSEHFHGAVGAFYAPVETAATPKNVDNGRNAKFGTNAFVANADPVVSGTQPGLYAGPGGWDANVELGGYIPGLRNKLFFFGSYNPTLLVDYNTPPLFAGTPAFLGRHHSPASWPFRSDWRKTDLHSRLDQQLCGKADVENRHGPNAGIVGVRRSHIHKQCGVPHGKRAEFDCVQQPNLPDPQLGGAVQRYGFAYMAGEHELYLEPQRLHGESAESGCVPDHRPDHDGYPYPVTGPRLYRGPQCG